MYKVYPKTLAKRFSHRLFWHPSIKNVKSDKPFLEMRAIQIEILQKKSAKVVAHIKNYCLVETSKSSKKMNALKISRSDQKGDLDPDCT